MIVRSSAPCVQSVLCKCDRASVAMRRGAPPWLPSQCMSLSRATLMSCQQQQCGAVAAPFRCCGSGEAASAARHGFARCVQAPVHRRGAAPRAQATCLCWWLRVVRTAAARQRSVATVGAVVGYACLPGVCRRTHLRERVCVQEACTRSRFEQWQQGVTAAGALQMAAAARAK